MKITGIEKSTETAMEDREFITEMGNLTGLKDEMLLRFDNLFKQQIKDEPVMRALRNVFLPTAFITIEEALELIEDEIARQRTEAKIL